MSGQSRRQATKFVGLLIGYLSALSTRATASFSSHDRSIQSLRVTRQVLELSIDSRGFKATLWKRIGRRAGTVVLFLHGGPFKGGPPSFPHGMRRLFLNLGYTILEPEYSGDQEAVDLGALQIKGYADIDTALKQISVSLRYLSQPFSKILIYGESFGAYLGAIANERLDNSVPLILYNPVMQSPRAFYIDNHPEGIIEVPEGLNTSDVGVASAIKAASDKLVQHYFDGLLDRNICDVLIRSRARTILIYGGADTVTPRANVEAARSILRRVRFYLIPEAGHEDPDDQPWVVQLRAAIATFVDG